jgi:tripartite-type tricarboxylate transporter receptor subunit TctC
MKSSFLFRLALGCCLAVSAAASFAQSYPAKPVKMLVGFPPGGGTDVVARSLAAELSKSLGQQFIVENKGGANGVIATTELAKAPADGYTLMMTISSHVTNTVLYPKLNYELKDFQPISIVATSPFVLIAHPSFKPNNVNELVTLAKAKANSVDYGSPGPGSTQHLSMELMSLMAGVQMTHIAYKGGAPALTDLLAGQIPLMFMTTVQSLPFLKDKKVKALAVSTAKRTPVLPDVPTIAESGVAGYESDVWFGVIAPAGTPRPIVDKLHAEIVRIVKTPEMQKSLAGQGAEPVGNTPGEFAALIKAEHAKWADVIKRTGIKPE